MACLFETQSLNGTIHSHSKISMLCVLGFGVFIVCFGMTIMDIKKHTHGRAKKQIRFFCPTPLNIKTKKRRGRAIHSKVINIISRLLRKQLHRVSSIMDGDSGLNKNMVKYFEKKNIPFFSP